MKAYVITTGVIFALILAAHGARLMAEGAHLLKEPVFIGTSLLSAGMCVWAWRVYGRLPRV